MACLVFRSLGGTEQNSNHKANAQGAAPQILWQPHQYLLHFEETKKWEWLPWATMLSCLHRDLTTDRHWGFQWSVPALHQVWTTVEETSEVNFLFFLLKNWDVQTQLPQLFIPWEIGAEKHLCWPLAWVGTSWVRELWLYSSFNLQAPQHLCLPQVEHVSCPSRAWPVLLTGHILAPWPALETLSTLAHPPQFKTWSHKRITSCATSLFFLPSVNLWFADICLPLAVWRPGSPPPPPCLLVPLSSVWLRFPSVLRAVWRCSTLYGLKIKSEK